MLHFVKTCRNCFEQFQRKPNKTFVIVFFSSFFSLRLNAAIYLTWAAKYLQFSKAKTQENFFKIA